MRLTYVINCHLKNTNKPSQLPDQLKLGRQQGETKITKLASIFDVQPWQLAPAVQPLMYLKLLLQQQLEFFQAKIRLNRNHQLSNIFNHFDHISAIDQRNTYRIWDNLRNANPSFGVVSKQSSYWGAISLQMSQYIWTIEIAITKKCHESHKKLLMCIESYRNSYCDAMVEMAAPVTPNPKTYIRTGKKNTAAKFPNPAHFDKGKLN